MRKKIFTQTFIFLFFISVSSLGQEVVFKNITFTGISVSGVSANGKYLIGSTQDDGGSTGFIYNTDTEKVQYFIGEEEQRGNTFEAVSNNGIVVGKTGPDFGNSYPAYFKDGEWFELLQPDSNVEKGYKGYGVCSGITADGNKIVGHVYTSPQQYHSCIWENIDGAYKPTLLEMPKKDIFGSEPKYMMQGAAIPRISTNGEVIIARFTGYGGDTGGKYVLPIVWKKTEENKYEYKILGEEIHYNLDKQIPERDLDVSDAEWSRIFFEFMKNTFISSYDLSLSGNGKYLATGFNETSLTTLQQTNSVLVFDLENEFYTIFEDPTPDNYICGVAAMNDGTIFGATPHRSTPGILKNGYVFYMEEEKEGGISIEDWIAETYEIELDFNEMLNTGSPIVSGDGNLVGANYMNSNNVNSFYYVKYTNEEPVGPDPEPNNISYNSENSFNYWCENSNLHIVVSSEQEISLYSIDGCFINKMKLIAGENVISTLPKGIYLLNNKKIVVK